MGDTHQETDILLGSVDWEWSKKLPKEWSDKLPKI